MRILDKKNVEVVNIYCQHYSYCIFLKIVEVQNERVNNTTDKE